MYNTHFYYVIVTTHTHTHTHTHIYIYIYSGGTRGVMVNVVGNRLEVDCISQSTNTLGKSMNLIIFHPALCK